VVRSVNPARLGKTFLHSLFRQHRPRHPTHGVFNLRHNSAICPTPFPINVDSSIAPSPVITMSAIGRVSPISRATQNNSKPGCNFAPAKLRRPNPNPPPRPRPLPPRNYAATLRDHPRQSAQILFRHRKNPSASVPLRPITRVQPRSPSNRFCTSTATIISSNHFARRGGHNVANACNSVQLVIPRPAPSRNSPAQRPRHAEPAIIRRASADPDQTPLRPLRRRRANHFTESKRIQCERMKFFRRQLREPDDVGRLNNRRFRFASHHHCDLVARCAASTVRTIWIFAPSNSPSTAPNHRPHHSSVAFNDIAWPRFPPSLRHRRRRCPRCQRALELVRTIKTFNAIPDLSMHRTQSAMRKSSEKILPQIILANLKAIYDARPNQENKQQTPAGRRDQQPGQQIVLMK